VVLREKASRTRQLVEEACHRHKVALDCVMQLNSREAIVHAVVQGIGIGFVSAVEYADQPGTKAVSFIEDPIHINYFLCCLGIRRNRPIIAELFESCALTPASPD
jgi:DNA-binding transcriptional LysR family regulator